MWSIEVEVEVEVMMMRISSSSLLKLLLALLVCFFIAQLAIFYNIFTSDGCANARTTQLMPKSKRLKAKSRIPTKPNPEGYFNGNPIVYRPYVPGWHSSIHCVGDNFAPYAWKYRSCRFSNFCFDMSSKSFVLFSSPELLNLEKAMKDAKLTRFTTAFSMNTTVSIGGINNKWPNDDIQNMEWFPEIRSVEEIESSGGYYTFTNDATLLPFHSLAGFNPGHLVWDDFLPIFTILTMFQLLETNLVLMRYKPKFLQWASCDKRWSKGRKPHCKTMMRKFLPLIGQSLEVMTTQENFNVTWAENNNNTNRTKYVCANNGAAGLGMLTDHGPKMHGWDLEDYGITHNSGRGGMLYDFRNWMVTNINIDPYKRISKSPYIIVFNVNSSNKATRYVHFKEHMKRLKDRLGKKYDLDIRVETMSNMSLHEQIELVSGASIMVTACGGGAVTAMFLPKGASLLVFFSEKERQGSAMPRLDWDLLNNLSYLRVHWMPRPQRISFGNHEGPREADYEAFISLIDHELDDISHSSTGW